MLGPLSQKACCASLLWACSLQEHTANPCGLVFAQRLPSLLVIEVSAQKAPTACYRFIALLWYPPDNYLQITEPGEPGDCHQRTVHQEEVISQPAIVSDSCKFFTDKWPPVDVFCNHVKARKKSRVQNEMDVETCSTTDIFNSTLQFMKWFFLFWWQFMTWNVAPKIWFKVKSEH